MRELRVVGLSPDGTHMVCQEGDSGDKFRIAVNDRLKAAARGDATRLGQIEIEMESALRPRDIQARIRAGATIAQVAAVAGVPAERIERFAHPVMLERQRATELAALAHPIRADGPALENLGEIVRIALSSRGHNPENAEWDAWKAEDNKWVVQISWRVGRSQTFAHWRYLPGSNGGVAESLDEPARELVDPNTSRPLRGLATLTPVVDPAPTPDHPELDFDSAASESMTVAASEVVGVARPRTPAPVRETSEAAREETADRDDHASGDHTTPGRPATTASADQISADVEGESSTSAAETEVPAESKTRKRNRSRTPSVPAWEDVLLGVRSNGSS
ncbi:septation protein SepH [Gordonia jinhuaensis]|nr:septation protein SepH [Gordonia jinhuaensis]